jgi:hypothetical protein
VLAHRQWHGTLPSRLPSRNLGADEPIVIQCMTKSHNGSRSRLAAMIGSAPLAIIGSLTLGRYGFLFGSVNRLRLGEMLGLVLGLLVAGLIESVSVFLVVTLPSSLVRALIGGILGTNLTAQHRPSPGTFLETALGFFGGILVLAFQRDQVHCPKKGTRTWPRKKSQRRKTSKTGWGVEQRPPNRRSP